MRNYTVIFDGHCLNDVCHVGNLVHPVVERDNTTKVVPGRPGVLLTGSRLSSASASMSLLFIDETAEKRMHAVALVESWLDVEDPRPLAFGEDSGQYYMAIPDNKGGRVDFDNGTILDDVTFLVTDPVRYGETLSATSSSGSVTVFVKGNRGAALNISCASASRDQSTGLWGVRIDGGEYMRLALGSGTHSIRMSASDYACSVDNTNALMTTDSDWIFMEPGEHTITREYGTGSWTVSWTERWL